MTELFQERMQIRDDLLAGKVPKRIPIYPMITMEFACDFAGIDLMDAHYNPEAMHNAFDKVCEAFVSDAFPLSNTRFPESYYRLGANAWELGSGGSMQHPEVELLKLEEYDDFIADPYGFMMETLLPRMCSNLSGGGMPAAAALAQGYESYVRTSGRQMDIILSLAQKHSYGPGLITGLLIEAPCDFLADILRGFKQISIDLRRCPDKVEAAVNAILPLMIKLALPRRIKPGDIDFIPLHQAPYMNIKQFERMYWPTLKALVEEIAKKGVSSYVILEHDFSRFFEHFATLPDSTIYLCEYGDPAYAKETIGKEHVIGGFFDPSMTMAKSKEDCIDEAKRLIDICAPGGRFYFGFSRSMMDTKSVNISTMAAVLEWVYANGVY